MRRLAAVICALGLGGMSAACATNPYPGEPASAHDQERTDEEAFILTIDAGRIGIFVDRIREGGALVEAPLTGGDELIGISKRLRASTLDFLATKESMCSDLKFVEISCVAMRPPSWLAEEPTRSVTTAELQRRVEQVQIMMGPLMDAACEAGKAKSGDGMFCSVE
jgi:hypothetical protein